MLRTPGRFAPALFVATLCLGASAPALADIEPEPSEKDEPTVETKDAKKDDDKADKKGGKDEAKAGGCSVETRKFGLAGFAGLVLVISASALRRRSR